jgi:hypothetical protein
VIHNLKKVHFHFFFFDSQILKPVYLFCVYLCSTLNNVFIFCLYYLYNIFIMIRYNPTNTKTLPTKRFKYAYVNRILFINISLLAYVLARYLCTFDFLYLSIEETLCNDRKSVIHSFWVISYV